MIDQLRRVQDLAWDIKDSCDELGPRKISERNTAVLEGIERDLVRIKAKLVAIRDVRKREPGPFGPPDGAVCTSPEMGMEGNDHG